MSNVPSRVSYSLEYRTVSCNNHSVPMYDPMLPDGPDCTRDRPQAHTASMQSAPRVRDTPYRDYDTSRIAHLPLYRAALGKLGKLALALLAQRLDLLNQSGLGGLAVTSLVDLLLEVLDLLGLEELDERVELGELLLDDGGGRSGSLGLEVVGRGDDTGNGLGLAFHQHESVMNTRLLPLLQVLPRGLLGLLRGLSLGLARLGGLLLLFLGRGLLGLLGLLSRLLLGRAHRLGRTAVGHTGAALLGRSSGLLLGLDSLDSRVRGQDLVDEGSQSDVVLLLSSRSLRLVLLLGESLVVSPGVSACL